MDIVTHILAGRAAGKITGGTRAAAVAGALGAVIPDLDSLVLVFPALGGILERRGALHSVLGIAFASAAVTAVILWLKKIRENRNLKNEGAEFEADWEQLTVGNTYMTPDAEEPRPLLGRIVFAAALAGGLAHLALDVVTPWGVKLLWPISTEFALGLTRGFDPWISALVVVMTYFTLPNTRSLRKRGMLALLDFRPMRSRALTICAAVLVVIYLALRFYLQAGSLAAVPAEEGDPGIAGKRSSYALSAFNPFEWRVVVETPEGYDIYKAVTSKKPQKLLSFTALDSPCIQGSKSGRLAASYIKRARYPYALFFFPENGVSKVVWRDMRDQLFQMYRSDEVQVSIDCVTGDIVSEEKTTWFDRLVAGTFWDKRGPETGVPESRIPES